MKVRRSERVTGPPVRRLLRLTREHADGDVDECARDDAGPRLDHWRAAARAVMRVAVTVVVIGRVKAGGCQVGQRDLLGVPGRGRLTGALLLPAGPATAVACSLAACSAGASTVAVSARRPAAAIFFGCLAGAVAGAPGRERAGLFGGGGGGGGAASRAAGTRDDRGPCSAAACRFCCRGWVNRGGWARARPCRRCRVVDPGPVRRALGAAGLPGAAPARGPGPT